MTTNTVKQVHLKVQITHDATPITLDCQVIDAELTLPGTQPGETTEVACPDGKVSEPGTSVDGGVTGNIYVDPSVGGVTEALIELYQAGIEFPYSMTFYANEDATKAMKFDGTAKVNTFKMPWKKPGNAKQPIDLKLITAVMSRPTPPLARRSGGARAKANA